MLLLLPAISSAYISIFPISTGSLAWFLVAGHWCYDRGAAWDSILVSNSYRLHWFLQTGTWPGLRRRTSLHRGVSHGVRHSYNLAVEQLQHTGRRLLGDVLALSLSGPLPPSMKVVLIHNGRCCVLCRWDKPSESPTSTHSFPY